MKSKVQGIDNETASERLLRWFKKPTVIVAIWTLLFILTVIYSELNVRSLISAFIAWVGGLVTAHMDYVFRSQRIYRDVSAKIARNREYNKNVY